MSRVEIVPNLGSICMLCQIVPPIQNSHVWPKFAVKWLKENSSPYIRRADMPNRRMQDVTTFPLLCSNCETRFSKFENSFCSSIFKPFQDNHRIQSFDYGRWLSKFAISLSWRMLAIDFADFVDRAPDQKEAATKAFEHWRNYLLGNSLKIQPYGHHMFFFSYTNLNSSGIADVPDKFHSYILRSFDGSVCSFEKRGVVFILLPGIAFWSPLFPNDDREWPRGSSIRNKGKFVVGQSVDDDRFGQVLHEGATLAYAQPLSDKQLQVVQGDYQRIKLEKTTEQLAKILGPSQHDHLIKLMKQ